MNISLTPELEEFVNRRVATGRYQSASEVVRESLRLLEHREKAVDNLRRQIRRGLDDARRGRVLDGEKVMTELLNRGSRRARKAG
jgi:antitoxin ParD1/3/4